ncbi:MAG TPA: hypothetical protein VGC36_11540, partial [Rhizomicrobium sp.]
MIGEREPPRLYPPNLNRARPGQRVAIVRGQDESRWTDFYHVILTVPWSLFFTGLFGFFVAVNLIFALLYLADPTGLAHSRHGNFWDVFLFSFETISSMNYTGF